jgi:hypothetical protein
VVASVAFDNRFPSERLPDRIDRVSRDRQSGEMKVEVLLSSDDVEGWMRSIATNDAGREIAVATCARGDCGGFGPPSENALTAIYWSRDGGASWDQVLEVAGGVWVTDIVRGELVLTEPWVASQDESGPPGGFWLHPSGKELAPPPGATDATFLTADVYGADNEVLWRARDGRAFLDEQADTRLEFPPDVGGYAHHAVIMPGGEQFWSWRERGTGSLASERAALFAADGSQLSLTWLVPYGCCQLALDDRRVIVPFVTLSPALKERYAGELPEMQDNAPYRRQVPAVLDLEAGLLQPITDPFARRIYRDRDGFVILAVTPEGDTE